jgi:hypothetical protein
MDNFISPRWSSLCGVIAGPAPFDAVPFYTYYSTNDKDQSLPELRRQVPGSDVLLSSSAWAANSRCKRWPITRCRQCPEAIPGQILHSMLTKGELVLLGSDMEGPGGLVQGIPLPFA